MMQPVPIGIALSAAILFAGCIGCGHDQPLPDRTTKVTPSKQDLLEFHRLRALALWESYEPVPRPREEILPDGTDPRYARCAKAWEHMQKSSPLIAAIHPMHAASDR